MGQQPDNSLPASSAPTTPNSSSPPPLEIPTQPPLDPLWRRAKARLARTYETWTSPRTGDPLWLKLAQPILTLLSICVAVGALLASRGSLKVSQAAFDLSNEIRQQEIERAYQVKRLDVEEHFVDRFHEIHEKFYPLEKPDEKELKRNSYYERLYGMQSEEYRHYRSGLLDPGTYVSWLRFRVRDYNHKNEGRRKIEEEQWKRVRKEYLVDKEFIAFMDRILKVKVDDTKDFKDDLKAEEEIKGLVKEVPVKQTVVVSRSMTGRL